VADAPPIPPVIWQHVLAFLREGRTGQITLDIHHGTVRDATFQERIRVEHEGTAVIHSA
jgi:hypothetical protein